MTNPADGSGIWIRKTCSNNYTNDRKILKPGCMLPQSPAPSKLGWVFGNTSTGLMDPQKTVRECHCEPAGPANEL